MSSEGIYSVFISDLSKTWIKVQVEVYSNAQPDGGTTDTQVNPNSIEIYSIFPIPPPQQASKETTEAASSASGNPVVNSIDKEKHNTFVDQITVGTSTKEKAHIT